MELEKQANAIKEREISAFGYHKTIFIKEKGEWRVENEHSKTNN